MCARFPMPADVYVKSSHGRGGMSLDLCPIDFPRRGWEIAFRLSSKAAMCETAQTGAFRIIIVSEWGLDK
jgi:hypothetical protein